MDHKSAWYLGIHRDNVVDDHINSLNIKTTACHICANDDIATFPFEHVQNT
jgi:hypothetical protein